MALTFCRYTFSVLQTNIDFLFSCIWFALFKLAGPAIRITIERTHFKVGTFLALVSAVKVRDATSSHDDEAPLSLQRVDDSSPCICFVRAVLPRDGLFFEWWHLVSLIGFRFAWHLIKKNTQNPTNINSKCRNIIQNVTATSTLFLENNPSRVGCGPVNRFDLMDFPTIRHHNQLVSTSNMLGLKYQLGSQHISKRLVARKPWYVACTWNGLLFVVLVRSRSRRIVCRVDSELAKWLACTRSIDCRVRRA